MGECWGVGTKLRASKAGQWAYKDYISNPNISNHKKHIARDTFRLTDRCVQGKMRLKYVGRRRRKRRRRKEGGAREEGSLKQVV